MGILGNSFVRLVVNACSNDGGATKYTGTTVVAHK